jgi:hypothetical protein
MITMSLLMILEIFTNITTIGRSNKLPAPAKVLIKGKEKEMVDSLEKKQTNDSNTKKEESSYKKGIDK